MPVKATDTPPPSTTPLPPNTSPPGAGCGLESIQPVGALRRTELMFEFPPGVSFRNVNVWVNVDPGVAVAGTPSRAKSFSGAALLGSANAMNNVAIRKQNTWRMPFILCCAKGVDGQMMRYRD